MNIPVCPRGIKFNEEHPMTDTCLNCDLFPCIIFNDANEYECDGACEIHYDQGGTSMIPTDIHNSLPKITYKETGWRKSLAAYRIAIWHEHENEPETAMLNYKEALAKLGIKSVQTMKTTFGLIQTINDLMRMEDIYVMCCAIDRFADADTPVLRLTRILAEHGVKDIAKASGRFRGMHGIGPKYEPILENARRYAQEHPEE